VNAELGSLTPADVAALDAGANEVGVSTGQLMEVAGWQVARCAWQRLAARPSPVLVVAGRGNNGGDGMVAARHLQTWGCVVSARVLSEERKIGELLWTHIRSALANGVGVEIAENADDIAAQAGDAQLVLDAMLGVGLHESPREPLASAIRALNEAGQPVLSVDVPSGLDAATGEAYAPCVRAATTCTLMAMKAGLWAGPGREHAGEIWVADIGMPVAAWQRCGIAKPPALVGGVLVPVPSTTPH
jgi:ADP-dependent NAD(P)H-hydrate dehydratase / NAD(P)H-hydrate epimerase